MKDMDHLRNLRHSLMWFLTLYDMLLSTDRENQVSKRLILLFLVVQDTVVFVI